MSALSENFLNNEEILEHCYRRIQIPKLLSLLMRTSVNILTIVKKNAGLLTLVLLTPDTSLELNAISQCFSYRHRCKDGCDYKCLLASMQALARQSKCFGFINVVLNLYRLQILRSTDSPKLLCLAALRSILTVSDWLHSLSAPVPVMKHICSRWKAGLLSSVELFKRSWPRKMKKFWAPVRSLSHANSKSDRTQF